MTKLICIIYIQYVSLQYNNRKHILTFKTNFIIKLQVIGNIGQDATKEEVNGKVVINFSVAHHENYKDQNGVKTKKTIWVRCSLWGSEAVAPYLLKGTEVYVEGTPTASAYSKDGKPEASLNLRVFRLDLLGSKRKDEQNNGGGQEPVVVVGEPGDDLPF